MWWHLGWPSIFSLADPLVVLSISSNISISSAVKFVADQQSTLLNAFSLFDAPAK
jgi:hypothetical protein